MNRKQRRGLQSHCSFYFIKHASNKTATTKTLALDRSKDCLSSLFWPVLAAVAPSFHPDTHRATSPVMSIQNQPPLGDVIRQARFLTWSLAAGGRLGRGDTSEFAKCNPDGIQLRTWKITRGGSGQKWTCATAAAAVQKRSVGRKEAYWVLRPAPVFSVGGRQDEGGRPRSHWICEAVQREPSLLTPWSNRPTATVQEVFKEKWQIWLIFEMSYFKIKYHVGPAYESLLLSS